MKKFSLILFLVIFLIFGGIFAKKKFFSGSEYNLSPMKEGNMKLLSEFENNGKIPSKYTCDGENLAPELTVSAIPVGTKSLVLIVDDPDAPMGTFVHWVLFNLPKHTIKINNKLLPPGVKQGLTDFGKIGWGGPCPPSGEHRYFFKIYAIDKILDLQNGCTKAQVERSIQGHIIEKAELIGLYKRK